MIQVKNLSKQYLSKDKDGRKVTLGALKDINLLIRPDDSYALVGESGSGKSTLGRMLAFVDTPTKGEILFDGINMNALNKRELRLKRADFQLVLQNAQGALNPRYKIYDAIAEPIRCLMKVDKRIEKRLVMELAERVQLSTALLERFPHELSGGQQKRVCIARAISVSPKFIIFDESVSGLDVTVRKQILDLILQLKKDCGCTFLFITHDIDVALYMADNILVMKEGSIVEQAEGIYSYDAFQHDYSRLLIESLPPKLPVYRQEKSAEAL